MTFKIKPYTNRDWYFTVIVRKDYRGMRDAAKRNGKFYCVEHDRAPTDTGALCCGHTTIKVVKGKMIKTPDLGVIFFRRDFLTAGVVAHECTHAAKRVMERAGIHKWLKEPFRGLWSGRGEEALATLVGNLTDQCLKKIKL